MLVEPQQSRKDQQPPRRLELLNYQPIITKVIERLVTSIMIIKTRFEGNMMSYLTMVATSNNENELQVGMIEITYKGYIKPFYKERHKVLSPFLHEVFLKSKDKFIPSNHQEDG